jgi:hypothetical protein
MLDGDRPSQRPIHGQRSAAGLYDLHCVDDVPCLQRNHGKDILLMKDIRVEMTDETEAGLQKKVDLYFKGWHPLGYGTRLVSPVKYDEERQFWVAVITRHTSCD